MHTPSLSLLGACIVCGSDRASILSVGGGRGGGVVSRIQVKYQGEAILWSHFNLAQLFACLPSNQEVQGSNPNPGLPSFKS